MSEVIIRPIDIARDAEGLAEMWNASDLQWPGSWNNGVPATAEAVRDWEVDERSEVVFVAEVDGEIAGYCSFSSGHGTSFDEGYLGLLNVHPRFQKRSIGRKLIQATIDYSVGKGWKRQSLDTWEANFGAVPAYKKTGHFWTPDSWVWMENYVPGALQMPIARPFFARHNWYESHVRTLAQGEDDERWEGLKVYTQRWQAEGEALTIRIDREARTPVAVETDTLEVAAIVSDIEPVAGEPVALRWRVVNKTDQPLDVTLYAQGDKGLTIDHRDAFTVSPRQTLEHSAAVKVEADAPSEKDDGTAPAVRSLIRLGADEVELWSGMRPKKALRLDTAPASISLTPGVATPITLQLRNERSEPAMIDLILTPPEGLAPDWCRQQVAIGPRQHISLPLVLTAAEQRVYSLGVRGEPARAEQAPLAESLAVFAVHRAGLLAQRSDGTVRLETEAARILVEAKAGAITFEDKARALSLGTLRPYIGPPYYPSDFRARVFALELSERAGHPVVDMVAEAEHAPGLFLHQRLELAPNGTLQLCSELENRGGKPVTRRVCQGLKTDADRGEVYLPLREGVVRSLGGCYPNATADAPRSPADYQEPWVCWDRRGAVIAMGWDATCDIIRIDYTKRLISRELTVPPGQRVTALAMQVYTGAGDWRDAQRTLCMAAPVRPAELRPVALARVEPRVLATLDRTVSARVHADTVSSRASDGQISIATPAGLSAEPATLPITGLVRGRPVDRDIEFALPDDRLGAFAGEARLKLPLDEARSPFTLLRLGVRGALPSGEEVRVYPGTDANHAVWIVDNGQSRFVIVPDYGPSVRTWRVAGENQLWSSFPIMQGFSWRYPTFGGLHPLLVPSGLELSTGYLHRERFTAQPIERVDAHGLRWLGVRLRTQPRHEACKYLVVEVDWLTLSGSNVLQTVVRVRNLRGSEQRVAAGHDLFGGLGATPQDLVLRGPDLERAPSHCSCCQFGQPWGALSNPTSGRTLLLVTPDDDVVLEDGAHAGRALHVERELRLAADEVREVVSYAVLIDSPQAIQGYLALKELAR